MIIHIDRKEEGLVTILHVVSSLVNIFMTFSSLYISVYMIFHKINA